VVCVSPRCVLRRYFVAYVDGGRVEDAVLDPPWTDFNDTVMFASYDITSLLTVGRRQLPYLWIPATEGRRRLFELKLPVSCVVSCVGSADAGSMEHVLALELGNGWWNPAPLLMWVGDAGAPPLPSLLLPSS
jgi:hypothetical protein